MSDVVLAHSRDSITQGSKSFRAASRLFDSRTREDAWLLYAWCRACDDAIDGQDHGHGHVELTQAQRRERLDRLYAVTCAALRGEPMDDPTFAAFQRVAFRARLPEQYPLEHLQGFGMDVEERTYETLEEVLVYCWHVAGVVGVMMTLVMGPRDEATLRRAQDLGIAFQLTNIARDAVDDARAGRIYLPAAWLREAGITPTPEAVADPANRAAVHAVARRLLSVAEPYYDSAREGLRWLPYRSVMAVAAARGVYREIGRKLIRKGPGAWEKRVSVGKPMKLWLFGRSLLITLWIMTLHRGRAAPKRPDLWSRI